MILKRDRRSPPNSCEGFLKLLSDNMSQKGQEKAYTADHVSSQQKINVQTDESDALKTTSNDISTGPQDDVLIEPDIGVP